MAEMTAAEAIAWLTEDKALGQECYSRKQIAQLIEQQQQQIEAINSLLPDNYSESKDWKASNTVNKIDWLKGMYECKKAEIEQLEQQIEQQAAEIAKKDRMIGDLTNIRDIQGQKGNYDQCEYMRGLFNGLEMALSIFTQTEPQFKEWLEKEAQGVE